jgi:hypothetical protein
MGGVTTKESLALPLSARHSPPSACLVLSLLRLAASLLHAGKPAHPRLSKTQMGCVNQLAMLTVEIIRPVLTWSAVGRLVTLNQKGETGVIKRCPLCRWNCCPHPHVGPSPTLSSSWETSVVTAHTATFFCVSFVSD